MKKPVITFISPTNLAAGAGNEWPIIYYTRNLYKYAKINVVQTDYAKQVSGSMTKC